MGTAQGIQTLLEAEKEAAKIVAKAHRVQRLKDARQDAAKDIEVLKAKKNADFVAFEKQFSGSSSDAFEKVNLETEERLKENNNTYGINKGAVVDKLMKAMVSIHPQVCVITLIQDSRECQNIFCNVTTLLAIFTGITHDANNLKSNSGPPINVNVGTPFEKRHRSQKESRINKLKKLR